MTPTPRRPSGRVSPRDGKARRAGDGGEGRPAPPRSAGRFHGTRAVARVYGPGPPAVFDVGVAALGKDTTRASDHLPVYADLVFGAEGNGDETPPGAPRTAAPLPDSEGDDAGRRR